MTATAAVHKHVFISHASADAALADALVQLLVDGCELRKPTQVFYSSEREAGVPSGEYLTPEIRRRLAEAPVVVALITPTYLTRPVCLAELGGAWTQETLFPLMLPKMNRRLLGGILDGALLPTLDDAEALDELRDRVVGDLGISARVGSWNRARQRWLEALPALEDKAWALAQGEAPSTAVKPVPEIIHPTGTWVDGPRMRAWDLFSTLARHGLSASMEIATTVEPSIDRSNADLRRAVGHAILDTFKWPFGKISDDPRSAPRPTGAGLETSILLEPGPNSAPSYDYWMAGRNGSFYSLVSLYEDEYPTGQGACLSWPMRIRRTAETISFLARYYRALGVSGDGVLTITLRYGGLLGRTLQPADELVQPGYYVCTTNDFEESWTVSLDDLEARFTDEVTGVLERLFDLFDGGRVETATLQKWIAPLAPPATTADGPSRDQPDGLRDATLEDVEQLAALKRGEEDRTYSSFGTPEQHAEGLRSFCSPEYLRRLMLASERIFLIEVDGRAEGMVIARVRDEDIWLHGLYVRTKRRGLGKTLVRAVGTFALVRGRSDVRCEIFAANAVARTMLEGLSFTTTGIVQPSKTYPDQQLVEYRASAADLASAR